MKNVLKKVLSASLALLMTASISSFSTLTAQAAPDLTEANHTVYFNNTISTSREVGDNRVENESQTYDSSYFIPGAMYRLKQTKGDYSLIPEDNATDPEQFLEFNFWIMDKNRGPEVFHQKGDPDSYTISAVDGLSPQKNQVKMVLPRGVYEIEMLYAPDGFYTDNENKPVFEIPMTTPDGKGYVENLVINQKLVPYYGTFNLLKLEGFDKTKLDGAEFRIERLVYDPVQTIPDKYLPEKHVSIHEVPWDGATMVDDTYEPVGVSEYEVSSYKDYKVTDGELLISDLPHGTYMIRETKSPDGYLRDLSKKIEVREDGIKVCDLTYDEVDSGPAPMAMNDGTFGCEMIDGIGVDGGNAPEITFLDFRVPEITKDFSEDVDGRTQENMAQNLEQFSYDITIPLPGDIKSYREFVVTETMTGPYDFNKTTFEFYGPAIDDEDGLYTTSQAAIVDGMEYTFTFDPSKLKENQKDLQLKVTTIVDFDRAVYGEVDPTDLLHNTVKLNYTNDAGHSGEIEDDEKTKLNRHEIILDKIDGNTEVKLDGAEFELWRTAVGEENGGYLVDTLVSDENGKVEFKDVVNGLYFLRETKAANDPVNEDGSPILDSDGEPVTYRLLEGVIEIDLRDVVGKGEVSTDTTHNETIKNYKSNTWMPNTGTLGALGIVAAGSALAGLLVLTKKKEEKEA